VCPGRGLRDDCERSTRAHPYDGVREVPGSTVDETINDQK
jgi:hypothetical protein